MDAKKINIVWAISLLVIGITTMILFGVNIIKIELPDIAVRALGMIDLLSLPVLAFASVKKARRR